MDTQMLRTRIIAMADSAGLLVVEPDTCWVDARVRCPYGLPKGQYLHRPEGFCHSSDVIGNGCAVYNKHVPDPVLIERARRNAVREHFEEHRVSVISELGARADELPKGSPERLALELAADVISDKNMDRYILLEEDLPDEQKERREAIAAAEAAKAEEAPKPALGLGAIEVSTRFTPTPPPTAPNDDLDDVPF